MKRAFTLAMAVALLIQSAAGALVFIVQLRHHQHEQWERVEAALEVETLPFTVEEARTQVHWENHKEFFWQGQMWDVKSVKATANGWEVKALADEKEKEIKYAFAQQTEAGNRASLPGKVKSLQLISVLPITGRVSAPVTMQAEMNCINECLPCGLAPEAAEPPPRS